MTDTAAMTAVHRQSTYQVRFDWGVSGAAAIAADADIVVWVDVLGVGTPPTFPENVTVYAAGFVDRSAVAARVLEKQVRWGRRCVIAVIAVGGTPISARQNTAESAGLRAPDARFSVEDFLAAGAVIDALATLGIDHCSPEAAAACAAFTGLSHAVVHLLSASVAAREAVAAGSASSDIALLGRLDSTSEVRILQPPAAATR